MRARDSDPSPPPHSTRPRRHGPGGARLPWARDRPIRAARPRDRRRLLQKAVANDVATQVLSALAATVALTAFLIVLRLKLNATSASLATERRQSVPYAKLPEVVPKK